MKMMVVVFNALLLLIVVLNFIVRLVFIIRRTRYFQKEFTTIVFGSH